MNNSKTNIKSTFFNTLKFILLIISCIAAAVIFVWPLWKFATGVPKIYTVIVLLLLCGALIYFAVRKIMKTPVKKTIQFFINLALIVSGFSLSIKSVFDERQLLSILILVIMIILITIFNILMNRIKNEK
ncbi:MAG: hypothetical protein K6E97_02355 [Treponema sp.]|nr:hypothetical protein [Treponema sp.]